VTHDTSSAPRDPLAALPEHRQRTFAARVERWRPDLVAALTEVTPGPAEAEALAERLLAVAARRFAERDDDLHDLDERRTLAPDWFQRPGMLGYAAYADRYAGTLAGVGERLDHLRDLGVTYLHLMPLLRPRPAPNDGGYAVMDYRSVREDLGTMDDLRALAARLRESGMSLCLDLVLNHVAREHEWAARARAGEAAYLDYFHVYPDRTEPDRWEQTLPEVFPDFAPGSFSWDDELDGWVWTTFNSWQWDLDWSNPAVLEEFADIICDLANAGCEVFRLDAIAFTWKRLGTDCQNSPRCTR
jgi:amylosucrase